MLKKLILKLGSRCNLNCAHCHSEKAEDNGLNPGIIPWINSYGFDCIKFSGGEPLLYMPLIRKLMNELNCKYYEITTNGTLLTDEDTDFFNRNSFRIVFSYDGDNDSRDRLLIPCWDKFSKIEWKGISSVFNPENSDVLKFTEDLSVIRRRYAPSMVGKSIWENFPHQTRKSPNPHVTKELAQDYCRFMAVETENDFKELARGNDMNLSALNAAFRLWVKKKSARGISCFNPEHINLDVAGNFLLCPYGNEKVGDISTGIDWKKIESFIPDRCRSCPIWDSCHNTCIANTTENECYIARVMNRHIKKLMRKYDISYERLEKISEHGRSGQKT